MIRLLLIGEVAGACGVSADTIRHYERKGVIPPVTRDGSGYRRYAPETVERVRMVRRALAIGFTLDELSRILKQRASGRPPCHNVRDLAARKLIDLDARIEELVRLRSALSSTIHSWDAQLEATATGELAFLLESLTD